MKRVSIFAALISSCFLAVAQTNQDLSVKYMLQGDLHVKSSIKDTLALGGFGKSNNVAKKYSGNLSLSNQSLSIQIDTTQAVTIKQNYKGYKLFIVNQSDTITKLDASDSRIDVIAEALHQGTWKPIQYLVGSTCGNSYHSVYLKPNEYWEFEVPKFKGDVKTKLRYRLRVGRDSYIYSNEIQASINISQLRERIPWGLDPYND